MGQRLRNTLSKNDRFVLDRSREISDTSGVKARVSDMQTTQRHTDALPRESFAALTIAHAKMGEGVVVSLEAHT